MKAIAFFVVGTALVIGLDFPIRMLDARLGLVLPGGLEWLGWLLIAAGIIDILAAEWMLLTLGSATGAPGNPPRRLVKQGIYRWVRNPIYLGGFFELLGLALVRSSITFLAVAFLFLASIQLFVVFVEEPRTERRLGADYRRYKDVVPRWVPRRPN